MKSNGFMEGEALASRKPANRTVMNDQNTTDFPRRKRPVHRPPVERHNQPVILFVTLAVQPRGNFLASDHFHRVFVDACGDADAWHVGRYVIMPDHVHVFCAPARWPAVGVKRWTAYLKERITKRLRAGSGSEYSSAQPRPPGDGTSACMEGEPVVSRNKNPLRWRWQPDCWDTQLRSNGHYHEKWEYVRQNPVRAGRVARAKDWPWQGELHILRW